MKRSTSFVAGGLSYLAAVALSQFKFGEERRFPVEFAELADQEHGQEAAGDRADDFFEGRELLNRVSWLLLALGTIFLFRWALKSAD